MGVLRALKRLWTRGWHAPAAALLLLATLLLLLVAHWTPDSPERNPVILPAVSHIPTPVHSELVTEKRVTIATSEAAGAEELPADAVSVRSRYVAGWARAHDELCSARGLRLRLLMLVTSAPGHAAARAAVRHTWGAAARRADVALAFVLGAAPPDLKAKLDAEDALYGDLVEGRFVDSYLNLTLKTLSMLDWAVERCPLTPRLLKADDDVFINVDGLLRFAEEPSRRAANATVWGKVMHNMRPVRKTRSKFFVPLVEFPGSKYPPYASGPAYLLTMEAARRLRRAAGSARWLRMEDVLVTGVLAAAARVRVEHAPAFLARVPQVCHACELRNKLAVHPVRYHEQFDLWRKLLDGQTKCSA